MAESEPVVIVLELIFVSRLRSVGLSLYDACLLALGEEGAASEPTRSSSLVVSGFEDEKIPSLLFKMAVSGILDVLLPYDKGEM